jgi:predicted adenylyl cyclase CyaB
MPCNIELKARLRVPAAAAATAAELATSGPTQLDQCDTYFVCAFGRLKLREQKGGPNELIWYQREDTPDAKSSEYQIVPVEQADALKNALAAGLGIDAVVKKRRQLWLVDNVRIHIDHVDELGHFLEFEAVLGGTDHDAAEATCVVNDLAKRMGIRPDDHVACSYRELVRQHRAHP